jgi:hypothetical protein
MNDYKLYYMIAPVAPIEGETIEGNLKRAKGHLKELLKIKKRVIAPWISTCEVLDDNDKTSREFGLSISLLTVIRCDAVIAVGPRWSPGMIDEATMAADCGIRLIDITERQWNIAETVEFDKLLDEGETLWGEVCKRLKKH